VPDEIRAVPDHVELAGNIVRRQYCDVDLDGVSGAVERNLDFVTRVDEEAFSIVMSRHGGKLLSELMCVTAKAFGGGGGHRSFSRERGAQNHLLDNGREAEPMAGDDVDTAMNTKVRSPALRRAFPQRGARLTRFLILRIGGADALAHSRDAPNPRPCKKISLQAFCAQSSRYRVGQNWLVWRISLPLSDSPVLAPLWLPFSPPVFTPPHFLIQRWGIVMRALGRRLD
jgi:hypothetical protein